MIYFDNSSTTKPSEGCVAAVGSALGNTWGNPSSLHSLGIRAEEVINGARDALAKALYCRSDEIFFTSGGTESNNLAVIGGARAMKRRGNRVVSTAVEHHSLLASLEQLQSEGFEVIKLKPDRYGHISEDDIRAAVTESTVLVSIMTVNNETGAIFPVSSVRKIVKDAGSPALIHTDAVQAFGKVRLNAKELGVDLMSVSAHKVHGPKGVGALYRSSSARILPILYGGGQEKGIRNGTEPVPAIAGFGAAVSEMRPERNIGRIAELNRYIRDRLRALGGIEINSPEDALPYILNISVSGYRSETLLHYLEARDIFVSSGSACAKGVTSHVLGAMGLSKERAESALRLSFSDDNTIEEADAFIEALISAKATLRRAGR